MPVTAPALGERARPRPLLEHFLRTKTRWNLGDWRTPLQEILLLLVYGTMADCGDYDHVEAWGKERLSFPSEIQPYHYGVPGDRWSPLLMKRVDPSLFSVWVREAWPDRPDLAAIDGKTSRRRHDRSAGKAPLHLVSVFAATARLMLGKKAVADIATANRDAGTDHLLAVKAKQPTLRTEINDCFAIAPANGLEMLTVLDERHGRIEERTVTVSRETEWLKCNRPLLGQLRLSGATPVVKIRCRTDTRYYISSPALTAEAAPCDVCGHWVNENRLHWVLGVVFRDVQA